MLKGPLNVHWELTNRCNLNCVHCYQQDDAPDHALPNRGVVIAITERIIEAEVFEVTLTGGEVLLVPELFEVIDRLNEAGVVPHVTSNGTLVDERRAEALAARRVTFQVSIDSADPSVHDGVRQRPGALDRAVRGIERLVAKRVPVSVSYTCMPQNADAAAGVVALAETLQVRKVCIGKVLPQFGDRARRAKLTQEARESDAAWDAMLRLREEYEGRVDVRLAFQGGCGGGAMPESACTAMDRDIAILHDGHAYPCPFVRSPHYNLGSVVETPLPEIWEQQRARHFRREKVEVRVPHCRAPGAASPRTFPVVQSNRTVRQSRDAATKNINRATGGASVRGK